MTKEELVSLLGSWENLFLLNKISPDPEEYLPLLMEIALEGKDTSSWRAVWVADKIMEQHPEALLPWRETIIGILSRIRHGGKRRQLMRMLTRCEIPESSAGMLFDYCQERLFLSEEKVAVKVYAMDILYNISGQAPELKQEVIQTLEQVAEQFQGAGIVARIRKIIVRLRKEIHQR
ncbi:MAG TPA: hypothetical protein PLP79_11735 [Prolixibacteraceae bacterium]|jgi:hypothetical protein|nr:hypothetical protein [Prolixibacteraceae bacterium]